MCLYPKLIKNPKYKATIKNGGIIPPITDDRVKYVPIGCQNCIECRKQKSREWQVRLHEDIKTNTNAKFITLTLSNESYTSLCREINLDGYDRDNAVATLAARRFLERWRKAFGTSLRHWLVTELGHNGTENIHLHGLVWTDKLLTDVEKKWAYGYVWTGKGEKKINYVNNRTVNYIVKYVSKIDFKHATYKSKILTSPGIGKEYTNRHDSKNNKFNGINTVETYKTPSGHKISLPIYWRNKIYTEQQREALWLQRLDKQTRWVCGEKISIKNDEHTYFNILQWHQSRNVQLGYGTSEEYMTEQQKTVYWEKKQYERQLRNLNHQKRTAKATINKYYTIKQPHKTITINEQLWYITEKGIVSQAYNNNQRQLVRNATDNKYAQHSKGPD